MYAYLAKKFSGLCNNILPGALFGVYTRPDSHHLHVLALLAPRRRHMPLQLPHRPLRPRLLLKKKYLHQQPHRRRQLALPLLLRGHPLQGLALLAVDRLPRRPLTGRVAVVGRAAPHAGPWGPGAEAVRADEFQVGERRQDEERREGEDGLACLEGDGGMEGAALLGIGADLNDGLVGVGRHAFLYFIVIFDLF